MVSKRNFLTITIIMAITFFLFQFLNIAKERWNDYEVNSYVSDTEELSGESTAYQPDENTIVYVGKSQNDPVGNVVANWTY